MGTHIIYPIGAFFVSFSKNLSNQSALLDTTPFTLTKEEKINKNQLQTAAWLHFRSGVSHATQEVVCRFSGTSAFFHFCILATLQVGPAKGRQASTEKNKLFVLPRLSVSPGIWHPIVLENNVSRVEHLKQPF